MTATVSMPRVESPAKPARKLLGRLAAKSDPRSLMFSRFAVTPKGIPAATHFWEEEHRFKPRTFGNTQYGDCTRASQAIGALRMEWLERRQTAHIDDEEVVRVFIDMCKRLYGGDAGGAYIMDALSCWRNPDYTFRDATGHPLTIDAYTRVHTSDQQEFRQALCAAASHGLVIGINLPKAFESLDPPAVWDIPEHQPATGAWRPGSLGGHAMWARDYNEEGIWLVHTWGIPDQLITWRAAALYIDEGYMVIDSIDAWRRRKAPVKLQELRAAVNEVSSYKLHN